MDKKIVFHGGCISCTSQSTFGVHRCVGCRYFDADWSLPDLSTHQDNLDVIREQIRKEAKIKTASKSKCFICSLLLRLVNYFKCNLS